jgi:transposase
MPHYVGLDVSQKTTSICVVDEQGRRLWRGVCVTHPDPITTRVFRHAGEHAKIGFETGSMTPWLVHGLRAAGLDVECLDTRRVKAALQMQLNKTDENDAEGLAQIMRTGWYRAVHVKSLDAHRARALLGARAQLVSMTTRLSNMIRGVLKTFALLPGAGRGLRFDRKVEDCSKALRKSPWLCTLCWPPGDNCERRSLFLIRRCCSRSREILFAVC